MGCMDGAYKGRLQSVVRFIGRKTLTERQKEYNVCTVVALGIVRNILRGSGIHLWFPFTWRV